MKLRFGVGLGVALLAAGGALSSCIFVYGEADTGAGGAGGFGGNPMATSVTTGGAGGGVASGAGGVGGVGGTGGGDCEDTVGPYTTELPSPVTELAVSLDGAAAFIGPVYSNGPSCGDPGMTQLAFYEKGTATFDDAKPTWCAPIPSDGIPAKQRHIAISDQRVAVAFNVSMGKAKLLMFERNGQGPLVQEFTVLGGSILIRSVVAAGDKFFIAGNVTTTNEAATVQVDVNNASTCALGEFPAGQPSVDRTFVGRIQEDGSGCTMALAALTGGDFKSLAVNSTDVLMRRLLPDQAGSELVRLDRAFTVMGGGVQRRSLVGEDALDYQLLAGAGDAWRTLAGTKVVGANQGACCAASCCSASAAPCCSVNGPFWPSSGPSVLFNGIAGLTADPLTGNTFVFGSANPMTGDPGKPRVLAVWDGGNSTKVWGASESEWPAARGGTVLGARPSAEGAELFIYAAGSKACKDRWVLERSLFTFVP